MAKKKELTDAALSVYRGVLSSLDASVSSWDNLSRDTTIPRPNRGYAALERDAWIIARDALEKVVRREQERRQHATSD